MSNSLTGFWNKNEEEGGPITGSGPGFKKAMAKHKARKYHYSKVGKWRAGEAAWKKDSGTYVDPDYYIVNQGQEL